jgi:hypothetical protein
MTEAADQAELDPDRLFFTRALNIVRRQVTAQAAFPPSRLNQAAADAITEILEGPNPPRRHRTCPRVIKRRRTKYPPKRDAATITRHDGPPEIRIWAPAALVNGIATRASLFLDRPERRQQATLPASQL